MTTTPARSASSPSASLTSTAPSSPDASKPSGPMRLSAPMSSGNWPPSAPSRTTAPGWPPVRDHDVTALTSRELQQARRDLAASLALARPGSLVRAPILAQMKAIDAALRARIRARFAELHEERERLETQLKILAKAAPAAADTTLLDQLPLAGDVLPDLPPRLKARLFQAFDIAVLWNKPASQATVHAEITDTTLQAVLAILNPAQDGYHDTSTDQPAPMGDLTNPPRAGTVRHRHGTGLCDPRLEGAAGRVGCMRRGDGAGPRIASSGIAGGLGSGRRRPGCREGSRPRSGRRRRAAARRGRMVAAGRAGQGRMVAAGRAGRGRMSGAGRLQWRRRIAVRRR
jgi:hypothetical protein